MLQERPRLPQGDDERFTGYGVMGLPFASGHYLAFRDMVASSIGPPYRAIWHRDPEGRWTMHTTGPAELTCPRYFGSVTATAPASSISVSWPDDHTLEVSLDADLTWRIELRATSATRAMTGMGGMLPEAGWNSNAVLRSMEPMARTVLRTGRIRLRGTTPNGPRFKMAPLRIWRIVAATASYRGEDLGEPAPLAQQTHLGDVWLPQRGVFFVGRARFTPVEERVEPRMSTVGTRMGT